MKNTALTDLIAEMDMDIKLAEIDMEASGCNAGDAYMRKWAAKRWKRKAISLLDKEREDLRTANVDGFVEAHIMAEMSADERMKHEPINYFETNFTQYKP